MALEYFRNLDRVELEDDILRRERFVRDESNSFTVYDEGEFLERFRVSKEGAVVLIDLTGQQLEARIGLEFLEFCF